MARLLATVTASNTASFDWALPPGFARFRFEVEGFLPTVDGDDVGVLVSTDGGTNFATGNYLNSMMYALGTAHDAGSGSTSIMWLCLFGHSNVHGTQTFVSTLYGAEAGQYPRIIAHSKGMTIGGPIGETNHCAEYSGSTDRVTHVRIKCSAGNISSGVFRLYGEE